MGVHAWLDGAFARVMRPSQRLYADGFGDARQLDACVRGVRDATREEVEPLGIDWRTTTGSPVRRQGTFVSPAPELPDAARRATVEQWLPGRPACLLLATTGEQGFARRRLVARRLARRGVGAVMLENPSYGTRRPPGQKAAALRTVADQFAMNLATVLEARALMCTLRELGAVTGFSQGGFMAAFAAAVTPREVAAVPRGAGLGVEAVFTSHALHTTMRWDVLARECGGIEPAKQRFREALAPVRLDRFPAPLRADHAVLFAARDDGFVPQDEARRLHAHWPGSTLRWLPAGHVTAVVFHSRAQIDAVADAVLTLASA